MRDGSMWRHTYKIPKFWIFDARLSILVLLTLLHFRVWTVMIVIASVCFLYYFEKRWGMTLVSSMRMIRCWMAGRNRPACSYYYVRKPIDYDRIYQSFPNSKDTGEPLAFTKPKKLKKQPVNKKIENKKIHNKPART